MNNIDKQHSWDRIHGGLIGCGELKMDPLKSPSQQLEASIERLVIRSKTLEKMEQMTSVLREPPLFTDPQLAQLKQLVSIAVWIRGEQLAHPNAVILSGKAPHLLEGGIETGYHAEIDTHNMNIRRARAEFEAGQQLFTLLQRYCEQYAITAPEWVK